jgi:1-acyl-sn-glycerol-3-phosphate acyltransferase
VERTNRPITIFYHALPIRILFEAIFFITFLAQSVAYRMVFGYKVSGTTHIKNIKHGILVSNHCHYLDPGFIASAIWPRRCYFSGMEQTFRGNILFSWFIRALGGFPIPDEHPGRIVRPIGEILKKKRRLIHFFPEGSMHPYHEHLLEFKTGAFSLANFFGVPVIPIVEIQRKRRPFPFAAIEMHILQPIYPDPALGRDAAIKDMQNRTEASMRKKLNQFKSS